MKLNNLGKISGDVNNYAHPSDIVLNIDFIINALLAI